MKKIDYKMVINGYINQGTSKDWLDGYIHCLCINNLVLLKERDELWSIVHRVLSK